MDNVNSKIKEVYDFLWEKSENGYHYDIAYIALIGSQNYHLDTEDSDYDFKAFVVPSLNTIAQKGSVETKVFNYNKNKIEQITIVDIRSAMPLIGKGNPNYLETLTTPYFYINHKYEKPMRELREGLDNFTRYNKIGISKALLGMMKSFSKNLTRKHIREIYRNYYSFVLLEEDYPNIIKYKDFQINTMWKIKLGSEEELQEFSKEIPSLIKTVEDKISNFSQKDRFVDSLYYKVRYSQIPTVMLKIKLKENFQ